MHPPCPATARKLWTVAESIARAVHFLFGERRSR